MIHEGKEDQKHLSFRLRERRNVIFSSWIGILFFILFLNLRALQGTSHKRLTDYLSEKLNTHIPLIQWNVVSGALGAQSSERRKLRDLRVTDTLYPHEEKHALKKIVEEHFDDDDDDGLLELGGANSGPATSQPRKSLRGAAAATHSNDPLAGSTSHGKVDNKETTLKLLAQMAFKHKMRPPAPSIFDDDDDDDSPLNITATATATSTSTTATSTGTSTGGDWSQEIAKKFFKNSKSLPFIKALFLNDEDDDDIVPLPLPEHLLDKKDGSHFIQQKTYVSKGDHAMKQGQSLVQSGHTPGTLGTPSSSDPPSNFPAVKGAAPTGRGAPLKSGVPPVLDLLGYVNTGPRKSQQTSTISSTTERVQPSKVDALAPHAHKELDEFKAELQEIIKSLVAKEVKRLAFRPKEEEKEDRDSGGTRRARRRSQRKKKRTEEQELDQVLEPAHGDKRAAKRLRRANRKQLKAMGAQHGDRRTRRLATVPPISPTIIKDTAPELHFLDIETVETNKAKVSGASSILDTTLRETGVKAAEIVSELKEKTFGLASKLAGQLGQMDWVSPVDAALGRQDSANPHKHVDPGLSPLFARAKAGASALMEKVDFLDLSLSDKDKEEEPTKGTIKPGEVVEPVATAASLDARVKAYKLDAALALNAAANSM
jgi:hypothetical protein